MFSAERAKNGQLTFAVTVPIKHATDLSGCLRSCRQDNQPRARIDIRKQLLDGSTMRRKRLDIRQTPAHPRARKLERRQLRVEPNIVGRHMP